VSGCPQKCTTVKGSNQLLRKATLAQKTLTQTSAVVSSQLDCYRRSQTAGVQHCSSHALSRPAVTFVERFLALLSSLQLWTEQCNIRVNLSDTPFTDPCTFALTKTLDWVELAGPDRDLTLAALDRQKVSNGCTSTIKPDACTSVRASRYA
jgi:hypothetical protein